jgi:TrmH family RNA methyltransferase
MVGPEKAGRGVRPAAGTTAAVATGVISSRDNRWLKAFRLTLRGGLTTESGSVGVEGVRLVEEALRSTCTVEAVLLSESGERHRQRLASLIDRAELGFPVLRTTDRLFEGIADTEHPQGVAALVKPREIKLEDLLQVPEGGHSPLLVVLAGVQDPGNVGTILRTAAAFGATGAVAASTGQGGTASPFSPKALRASAGAALHLPVMEGMSLAILMTQFKVQKIKTVASCVHEDATGDLKPPVCPWEVNWCEPMALLVGNEGAGLPEEVVHGADERIHIPMATRVESLNSAAAAAVLFYEAYRQRSRRE